MLAAGGGHDSCLEILLAAVANDDLTSHGLLDVADMDGSNASHYACKAGEAGALALLADAGARLDLPSGSSEAGNALHPSHLAVVCGFLFCLEELAARNVNLEATDGEGETVLSLAVQCGSEACVEFLLLGGAADRKPLVDPNHPGKRGEPPLNTAARRGRLSFLPLLLNAGADPAGQDCDGETAVHAAARYGQVGVLEWLAQASRGGDVSGNGKGQILVSRTERLPLWWFMTSNAGETPTFVAAREGNVSVCRVLQAIDVLEPSRPNADGVTPMVVAALAGRLEVRGGR